MKEQKKIKEEKAFYTLQEVMEEIFSPEEINELNAEIEAEVKRIRGGARPNSGRKTTVKGQVLKFTKRLTEDDVKFIEYARKHHIDYNDLMEG